MVTCACLRYAREGQNVTQAGPKCHTSRAKMSHKGQNVTQSCYNVWHNTHYNTKPNTIWFRVTLIDTDVNYQGIQVKYTYGNFNIPATEIWLHGIRWYYLFSAPTCYVAGPSEICPSRIQGNVQELRYHVRFFEGLCETLQILTGSLWHDKGTERLHQGHALGAIASRLLMSNLKVFPGYAQSRSKLCATVSWAQHLTLPTLCCGNIVVERR